MYEAVRDTTGGVEVLAYIEEQRVRFEAMQGELDRLAGELRKWEPCRPVVEVSP